MKKIYLIPEELELHEETKVTQEVKVKEHLARKILEHYDFTKIHDQLYLSRRKDIIIKVMLIHDKLSEREGVSSKVITRVTGLSCGLLDEEEFDVSNEEPLKCYIDFYH